MSTNPYSGATAPKAAILISAFNAADYLQAALDSALAQDYGNFEVLVMDDGSTDTTLEILHRCRDPRLRFFSRENRGKSASLNELLAATDAEFFAIQDADDLSTPDRLRKLIQPLLADPQLALVQSGYRVLFDDGSAIPIAEPHSQQACRDLIQRYQIPAQDPTMGGRVEIARRYGFNPDLPMGIGIDFILRVAEHHPMCVIDEILYIYRFHANSMTKAKVDRVEQQLLTVFNNARRRRGEPLLEPAAASLRTDKLNNLHSLYLMSVKTCLRRADRAQAWRIARTSASHLNHGWRYLKPLAFCLLNSAGIRRPPTKGSEAFA